MAPYDQWAAFDPEQVAHAPEGAAPGRPPIQAAFMAGQRAFPVPKKMPKHIADRVGERPDDPLQGKLWDKVVQRILNEDRFPEAVPLQPDRKADGSFKYVKKTEAPIFKTTNYDLANAPMLGKKGIGWVDNPNAEAGRSYAEAPEGTQDTLDKDDLAYLNPTDRLRMSHMQKSSGVGTYADKLVDEFNSIKDIPEVMKAERWYKDTVGLLRKHFGRHADLVANLLAATSARTGVGVNYNFAMEAFHRFLNGDFDKHIDLYQKAYDMKNKGALAQHLADAGIIKPEDIPLDAKGNHNQAKAMSLYLAHHKILPVQRNEAQFGMNSLPVLKVLAHTWHQEVGGPKTPNYSGNMSGRTLQATIDMWAARTMRRLGYEGHTDEPWRIMPSGETGVNNTDFALGQLAFRQAAKKLNMDPMDLQAILWFNEQRLWQKNGWEEEIDPAKRDYRPLLEKYERPEWVKPTKQHEWLGEEAA
jgi:hypothetical protein